MTFYTNFRVLEFKQKEIQMFIYLKRGQTKKNLKHSSFGYEIQDIVKSVYLKTQCINLISFAM